MYIVFFQDKLIRGELQGSTIIPITTQLTGQDFAECFNYTKKMLLKDGGWYNAARKMNLSKGMPQDIPSIYTEFWKEKVTRAKKNMLNAADAERYALSEVLREAWKACAELSRLLPCVNQGKSQQDETAPLELTYSHSSRSGILPAAL